jgi:hypothetical protein
VAFFFFFFLNIGKRMSYRTSVASALREPIEHLLWVIFVFLTFFSM